MTRCEFWGLDSASCAHCQQARPARTVAADPRPDPARTARPTWDGLVADLGLRPGWHTVLSRGQCSGCGSLLGPGAQYTIDETTGRWVAECCDPEEDE